MQISNEKRYCDHCNNIVSPKTHEEYGEVTETCPHHGRIIKNSAHFGAGKGKEPMNKQDINNNIKKPLFDCLSKSTMAIISDRYLIKCTIYTARRK